MKINILLVEYDSEIIEAINQLLGSELFDITTAGDHHIARKLLSKKSYQMVISAALLPKSHGFILSQYITQNFPATKVIIIGENIDGISYQKEAQQYGFCEFIQKPLDGLSFRNKVFSHLGIQKESFYTDFNADSTNFMVLPPLDQLRPRSDTKTINTLTNLPPNQSSPFDDIIDDVSEKNDAYEIDLEEF